MAESVPEEVEELLRSEALMAHLATCVAERPHVAPVWYAYDNGVIEVLTTGRKLRNIRENPQVALSIQKDEAGRAQWAVTLLGRATIVESEDAIRDAAARINPKYGADPSAWAGNVLVRIEPGTVTHSTY